VSPETGLVDQKPHHRGAAGLASRRATRGSSLGCAPPSPWRSSILRRWAMPGDLRP